MKRESTYLLSEVLDKLFRCSLLLLNAETAILVLLQGSVAYFSAGKSLNQWLKERVIQESDTARFTFFLDARARLVVDVAENHVKKLRVMISCWWRQIVLLADFLQIFKGEFQARVI